MTPRALAASIDFARFASEFGGTLYLSSLLHDGFAAWPTQLQERFCGLSHWQGVGEFKASLRRLTRSNTDSGVILAARSASMMKLAARLFSGPCSNVLVTDTTWPAYRRILSREFEETATLFTAVAIRSAILKSSMPAAEVCRRIVNAFVASKCDGLFLPLVDNLGVRLPIERIVGELRATQRLRFVVIDGAQALGHVPLALDRNYCDFLLAGTHKWLRAFSTMGLGFYGHPASMEYIQKSLRICMERGLVDDPLLQFSDELQTRSANRYGETVQVSPLLTASAAVEDAARRRQFSTTRCEANRQAVKQICLENRNWRPLAIDAELATQITLIQHLALGTSSPSHEAIGERLLASGVAATSYPNGLIRLSLPDETFRTTETEILGKALSHASS